MRTLLGFFQLRVHVAFVALTIFGGFPDCCRSGLLPPLRYPIKRPENRAWSKLDAIRYERASGYTAALTDFHPSADDAALKNAIGAYCNVVEKVRITQDGRSANRAACTDGGCGDLCLVMYLGRGSYECIVANLACPASLNQTAGEIFMMNSGTDRERTTELSLGTYLLPRR